MFVVSLPETEVGTVAPPVVEVSEVGGGGACAASLAMHAATGGLRFCVKFRK